jgi:hypothetical protein
MHRNLMCPPEQIFLDLPWPEQTHFNLRVITSKWEPHFLPPLYNDRHRKGNYLRNSFILHYAAMQDHDRVAAAYKDLSAWQNLFR